MKTFLGIAAALFLAALNFSCAIDRLFPRLADESLKIGWFFATGLFAVSLAVGLWAGRKGPR